MTQPAGREELATDIIQHARALSDRGLGVGTSGNISARFGDGFLITPSGVPYPVLAPSGIVFVGMDGSAEGGNPSSEWRFHLDIYAARPDVSAIVHAHSPHATALASLRRDIPAFHYMVAVAGGHDIRCAAYATFGTQALSDAATEALRDRRACLLANHGQISTGTTVEAAFSLAREVEELSRQYTIALQAGEPVVLDRQEMDIILEKFRTYGQQHDGGA